MSTTTAPTFTRLTADERDAAIIAELTERIDASAALHGPVDGFRPELRERRAEAQRRIDDRAAARAEREVFHLLAQRPVSLVSLSDSPAAKLHVEGDTAPALCGAWDRSDDASNGSWAGETLASRVIGRGDVCGRCQNSLLAWAKND